MHRYPTMNSGIPTRLPRVCPYSECVSHLERNNSSPDSRSFVREGFYRRADGSRLIPRFRCRHCFRRFSTATFSPSYRQKRRHMNPRLQSLLSSGVSQRRAALILKMNRKTVVRKFVWLGAQARRERLEMLDHLRRRPAKIQALHFDEMESFERSKCLPLSIPLAVDPETRRILSFQVAVMPASGPLAEISRLKYGRRRDERKEAAAMVCRELEGVIAPNADLTTDQNPRYPSWWQAHFPKIRHRTTKGRRGCVTGQGELKRIGFDPLFALNHTAAMKRANINRLFRRTWCTSKRADRLQAHLEIYARFHNRVLTMKPSARGRLRIASSGWHGVAPTLSTLIRESGASSHVIRSTSPA